MTLLHRLLVALSILTIIIWLRKRKLRLNRIGEPEEKLIIDSSETVQIKTEFPVYWYEDDKKKKGVVKMAQGLQVFDDNENCILDVTDRLCRLLGSHATGVQEGSFTVTGLAGNKLFAFLVGTKTPCDLTISGGRISWRYADFALAANMPPNGVIIYGSY